MPSSIIKSLEHGFAVAAQDVVKAGKTVETTVIPALKKVNADAATIEAVTAAAGIPQAVAVERVAFGVLGQVLAANDAAIAAGKAGGLSVTLDEQTVADLKAIGAALKPAAVASVSA